ncbi:MAG: pilus assembly protein TadC [Nitrospira sp. OLB3]|nr:MAG: pilus assembly protein TadC [Nitrospira sp. OLB3]MEB2338242.1 type II secretion system F family protein [Nitrospirales bacterium]
MELPVFAALSTFLVILLAGAALFLYLNSREMLQTWRRRVEGHTTVEADGGVSGGFAEQVHAHVRALLEWFAKFNQPSSVDDMRATRRRVITAGYRGAKAPVFYMGTKLLLAVLAVAMVAMIPAKALGFPTATNLIIFYLLAATCAYYAPSIWLSQAIAHRQDALLRAIPDALDLMVVCVEAGLGLDQAIARVGEDVKQTHPVLGEELNVLALELRTGVQRQEALRNLAYRTDLEEVKNLVALLVQTDRFGTSIGQALRVHADSMRATRRLKAEELAAKLPVKLLLPLIFFIFPSMFVVTIGPAVIRMVRVLFPALAGH